MAAWLLAYEARLSYVYMLLLTGLEIYIYIYSRSWARPPKQKNSRFYLVGGPRPLYAQA